MAIGLVLVYPLIQFIRLFIQEPRPFLTLHLTPLISPPTDLSFPSGHSSFMGIVASAYIVARSKWAWVFVPLALLVGFSRIYVGVHYPLDVLGGFILGFLIVFCIKKILRI
ncbi:MAG: phosphatase PAP2 family protein [Patescibacteria group bacterium]|nr:phosphatase PAP2 family protein [Patescibacteria group bacterium]